MYVCICNSVTDKEIRAAVEAGQDSLAKLQETLGVGTCCGKCEPLARDLIAEVAAESLDLNLTAAAA